MAQPAVLTQPNRAWPISRDHWLALALVAALALVLFVSYARQGNGAAPPLASTSTAANGGRALWLWLEQLGYTVDNRSPAFAIPADTALVLMLEPITPILEDEWQVLDAWVEDGGTLILAGDRYSFPSWVEQYELERLDWGSRSMTTTLRLQHPLFDSPLPTAPGPVVPDRGVLEVSRDDVTIHAANERGPLIVSLSQGDGQVILSTTAHPFSNIGLRTDGAPELVLNLLTLAGPPGQVWFNEWHHGVRPQGADAAPVGIDQWLRRTVAGRAILFALGVIFLALVLQGRAFGRPLPPPKSTLRRTPLEYVSGIANLHRRAGHRSALARDYQLRLKRTLGRRYRLDPTLPDEEFVTKLAAFNPTLDQTALRHLLHGLAQPKLTENQLVQLAGDVAVWVK